MRAHTATHTHTVHDLTHTPLILSHRHTVMHMHAHTVHDRTHSHIHTRTLHLHPNAHTTHSLTQTHIMHIHAHVHTHTVHDITRTQHTQYAYTQTMSNTLARIPRNTPTSRHVYAVHVCVVICVMYGVCVICVMCGVVCVICMNMCCCVYQFA